MSDLGAQIRTYYEDVVDRVDPMAQPVSPPRSHSYRPVWVVIATVVIVIVVIGLAPFLARWAVGDPVVDEPSTTTTTLEDSVTTSIPDQALPTTTIGSERVPSAQFKNPLLLPFLGLPACGDHETLAVWATTRMGEFADLGAWSADTVESVSLVIPIYRNDAITCFDAVRFDNGAVAWAGYDADGGLVAKAVARPADGDILTYVDYDALEAAGGEYHQDSVGSGQPFTGWIIDGGIEADIRTVGQFRHFIMEIPGYELPHDDPTYLQAGGALLSNLAVNSIESSQGAIYLGMSVPDGFALCASSIAVAPIPDFEALNQPVNGVQFTFCDTNGTSFRIVDWFTQPDDDGQELPPGLVAPPPDLPDGSTVSLGGRLTYRAWQDTADGQIRWYGATEIPFTGQWILVEGTPTMSLDDITTMLASSPWLNAEAEAALDDDGENDLRDRYSPEWITNILVLVGATNIGPEQHEPHTGPSIGDPSQAFTTVFDHESVAPLRGVLFTRLYNDGDPSPIDPLLFGQNEYKLVDVNGVTLALHVPPDGGPVSAVARCGGVGLYLSIQDHNNPGEGEVPQDEAVIRRLATQIITFADC